MAPLSFRRPLRPLLVLFLLSLIIYYQTRSTVSKREFLRASQSAASKVFPHNIVPPPKPKPRNMKWKAPPFQPLEPDFYTTSEHDGSGVVAGQAVYWRRIVAVGDVHGDLPHLTSLISPSRILRHLNLLSLKNEWIGGRTILVQTGDIVDRGKDTIALYRFFDILRPQAERAGGALVNLLGNHELMNAMHDWRYVTPEDIASFGGERARMEAMTTGWIGKTWRANYSIIARVPLAPYGLPVPPSLSIEYAPPINGIPTSLKYVQDPPLPPLRGEGQQDPFSHAAIAFVHGGTIPEYLRSLFLDPGQTLVTKINEIGSSILESLVNDSISPLQLPPKSTDEQRLFWSEKGPMWNREYALHEDEDEICERAKRACDMLGVRRMVMGHTPDFDQVRERCGGRILLIDTGISRAYGGSLSALEIITTYTPQSPFPAPFIPGPQDEPITLDTPRGVPDGPMSWLEKEVVKAIYVGERGRDQVVLAEEERYVELPGI
ncbi:BZ3500_MvSof-1268-A1-R1_Chr2-3g05296 [Microbotryum saponariae]|uniref:BZ3500_MvSof-1268-A1-R1_Chr2-3g05296 protein n=1 Tax=Microbotryum saponariae TaxID=289078 RepID=A0A2X0L8Y1_9BASI|nr:BZ3500_MvSof-1268-A1-R1_Chr2-3g05296 [Microbotryum saponariae]SDA01138.1 BZ3501_MvSof-1269-A2-R1_Chr2-2g04969 [Microbotryum saponariae]